MKNTFIEICRSVIAILVSAAIFGLVMFSGPAFFALWYWFLQIVALVAGGFIVRVALGRIAPSWVMDSIALGLSAVVTIGITYSIAYSDGFDAAFRAAQLSALCTIPVAAIAFGLIVLSRRYIKWPNTI
ncbi:MAG: hypothetical protein ACTHVY_03735 [Brevibacterium yomogidense]|uniref:hypothetical protein n=1 Tax=Brevibacterium sp. Mu109 TaxID=1255669 RepID=UPI0011AF841B|nr:hypothetical protein [Brevibacterium sp. Mu109]